MQGESGWLQKRSRQGSTLRLPATASSPKKRTAERTAMRRCLKDRRFVAVMLAAGSTLLFCSEGTQPDHPGALWLNGRDDLESHLRMSRRRISAWYETLELSRRELVRRSGHRLSPDSSEPLRASLALHDGHCQPPSIASRMPDGLRNLGSNVLHLGHDLRGSRHASRSTADPPAMPPIDPDIRRVSMKTPQAADDWIEARSQAASAGMNCRVAAVFPRKPRLA